MTQSIVDELGIGPGLLRALTGRALERRLALDLADAEMLDGLYVESEPGQVSAPMLRMAADSGGEGRYATDPPLALLDGSSLRVTLEPTADSAWIATAERLWTGSSPLTLRPRVLIRVTPREGGTDLCFVLPEGEDMVASLARFEPGAAPIIEAGFED